MATPDDLKKELSKITQSTGSVSGGGLDTSKGRASWQIRTRRDIASIIYQLNTVYYNIVQSLTDGTDTGRENVLETGIAGTNIICYQDATAGSFFWADLLEKPATIKEVFDAVLSKISEIENQITATSSGVTYDDTSLVSRLDCIELNLLQIMKDTIGAGSYGCDGSNDFAHSLASLINAIGANFSGYTPIHTAHSGETAVSSLTLSILSSGITWDVPVAQVNVNGLKSHLSYIRTAIGMASASDSANTFSTEVPSAASAGNNFIADGDSLKQAVKALDSAVANSWSTVSLSSGGGSATGVTTLEADNAGDTLTVEAGAGISLIGSESPEKLSISVSDYSLQDAYGSNPNGRIILDNTYSSTKAGITLVDNATPLDSNLFQIWSSGFSNLYFRIGKHENYDDHADYQTYRMDLAKSPIYLRPNSYTPATTGFSLTAPFNGSVRSAIWVSSGTSSFQDSRGRDLQSDHLYYRKPNQGTIYDLADGIEGFLTYQVPDPPSVSDPHEQIVWTESASVDTRLSRTGDTNFLTYQEDAANGGQVHWSIGVVDPTANDTAGSDGANYVAFDLHETPLLLSKLSSSTNIPETTASQGALFIPNDSTNYGGAVTAGRIYYRAPNNGSIYDLTSAGSGSAQNLYSTITADFDGGLVDSDSFPTKVSATGSVHFHTSVPLDTETITITDTNGLTRTYTATTGATDAANGLFNNSNSQLAIDGLDACIVHANGHNGSITTNQPANDKLDLTQIAGVKGNVAITNTFSASGSGITITGFSGGSSSDTATSPTDAFTFTAGPGITFDLSSSELKISSDLGNYTLNDISNVSALSPTDGQIIVYQSGTSLYELKDYSLSQTSGGSGISLIGADTAGGGKTVKGIAAASSKLTVVANGNNADVDIDVGTLNIDDLSDVTATTPSTSDVLMWTGSAWVASPPSDYRRSAVNVGGGEDLVKQVTDDNIEIRSITTTSAAISIYTSGDEVVVDYTAPGDGWPSSSGTDSAGFSYEAAEIVGTRAYLVLTMGTGGTIQTHPTDGTATGGDSRGLWSIDLQGSRTASTQVASGSNSFIGGGAENTASGDFSSVLGGTQNIASSDFSFAIGKNAVADHKGELAHASSPFSLGTAQYSQIVLQNETSNATPAELTSDGNAFSAVTRNALIIDDDTAYQFEIQAVAREDATGDTAWWKISGCIKRGTGVASTALVGSQYVTTDYDAGASAWQLAVTADTTNGLLKVEATGEAAHTIRWVATTHLTKVSG